MGFQLIPDEVAERHIESIDKRAIEEEGKLRLSSAEMGAALGLTVLFPPFGLIYYMMCRRRRRGN